MVNPEAPIDPVAETIARGGGTPQPLPPAVEQSLTIPGGNQAAPAQAPGALPPAPVAPPLLDEGDFRTTFRRLHGREPADLDIEAAHAVPMITASLGRPPTRIELLQWLNSRTENPPPGAQVFQEVRPDIPAQP